MAKMKKNKKEMKAVVELNGIEAELVRDALFCFARLKSEGRDSNTIAKLNALAYRTMTAFGTNAKYIH